MKHFREDLEELFTEKVKDHNFAKKVYASITNMRWVKKGETTSYTFRGAAGIIADLRGKGEIYTDFYCCTREGVVYPSVEKELLSRGWVPVKEGGEHEDT